MVTVVASNPKVSIIVPAFNAEQYLGACVDSILGQSFSDFELLIVDDGSVDDTASIAESYEASDSRVRVLRKSNGGLSSARNYGVRFACGTFILFVDADDYIDWNYLVALLDRQAATDADVVIGSIEYVWPDSCHNIRLVSDSQFDSERDYWISAYQKSGQSSLVHYTVSWGKLIKREAWGQLEFKEGKIHEDEFAIHRLIAQTERIVFTSSASYFYRMNENGIMHKHQPHHYLDGAEALLDRAHHFAGRGWRDLSIAALTQSRCLLLQCVLEDSSMLNDAAFSALRKEGAKQVQSLFFPGSGFFRRLAIESFFFFCPSAFRAIYVVVRGYCDNS